jgi:hypothetical protein
MNTLTLYFNTLFVWKADKLYNQVKEEAKKLHDECNLDDKDEVDEVYIRKQICII